LPKLKLLLKASRTWQVLFEKFEGSDAGESLGGQGGQYEESIYCLPLEYTESKKEKKI